MVVPTDSTSQDGESHQGIDRLLAVFAPGQLSEIVGPWSSGSSSLLLALIARATAAEGQVALVDWADSFDPSSAAAAGADLGRLLWVKCGRRLRTALGSTEQLVRSAGFGLVALDLGDLPAAERPRLPPTACLRLRRAVEGRAARLILRTPHRLAGSSAGLVVSMRRVDAQWNGRPHPTRFAGLRVEARILRSRGEPHGVEPPRSWIIEWPL